MSNLLLQLLPPISVYSLTNLFLDKASVFQLASLTLVLPPLWPLPQDMVFQKVK